MNEYIQDLIKEANRRGLRGEKVLAWIPPKTASEDPRGMWVIDVNPTEAVGMR